jgi:hypothetical protein
VYTSRRRVCVHLRDRAGVHFELQLKVYTGRVQTMKDGIYIGSRELRRDLKAVLGAGKVRIIGDRWMSRAFLVPLPKHESYDTASRRRAITAAARAFRAAVAAALS